MSSPHASDASRPPGRSRRTLVVALVAAVVLLLGGGAAVLALTGDEEEDGRTATEPGEPTAEGEAPGVAVPTRVVRVAGTLHPAAERRLAKQTRMLLEQYVEDAYVGRGKAFPGFTDKARRLARRDADVTTGRRLGGDEVAPVLRSGRARVAVLSPRPRQPVGATAAVRLVLTADGSRSTVTGQLHLTPTRRGWQVFGYDLAMSGAGGRVDASTEKDGTSGGNG